MRLSKKNKIIIALIFGAYMVLAILLINPYQLVSEGGTTFDFFVLFITSTFSSFLLMSILNKGNKSNRILFLLSFVLCCVFSGFASWLVKNPNEQAFLLFISAFFIIAIPPTIVILILLFFSNYNKVESTELSSSFLTPNKKFFELKNSKGSSILKIDSNQIIYFESNDNYVYTYYIEGDLQKKSMDRISLKKVEQILEDADIQFERVHKSFIVNPVHIREVSGKSQAYKIHMEFSETEIPASRKFDVSRLKH